MAPGCDAHHSDHPRKMMIRAHETGGRFDQLWRSLMVNFKDRAGNGESGFWGAELLPVIVDLVALFGLFLFVVGLLILLGEGLAIKFGGYSPM
jgi:hypothetical protein